MYQQVFRREIGGGSRYGKKDHRCAWRTPQLTSDVFLERFETASCDQINMSRYTDGLPMTCQFGREIHSSHLCAVSDEEGLVQIFDTRSSTMAKDDTIVKRWQAHENAVFDFAWINGDSQCLTSSGDQSVVLWDVEKTAKVTTFRGHDCSVRSVDTCPGNPAQCASGARDGHVMLWDCRVNKRTEGGNGPVKCIKYAHSLASQAEVKRHRRINRAAGPKGVLDTQQSVTCVLYQKDNLLVSSGAVDGCVKFWDTRKWYSNSRNSLPVPLQTFEYPGRSHRLKVGRMFTKGIVTMCMNPWNSQLFVSYTDNRVYRFDIAGAQQMPAEYVYAGHRNDTFYVRCVVSPDGKYLLSGSGRNTGVIWQVDRPQKRPVFLIGHTQDVSSVDWCPTNVCTLATLSDDMTLRIWHPSYREPDTEDASIVGFAYLAQPGKKCQRESRVHIVQDEFPFHFAQGNLQAFKKSSPAPGSSQIVKIPNMSHHLNIAHSGPPSEEPSSLRNQLPAPFLPTSCLSSKLCPNSSPTSYSSQSGLWLSKDQFTPPPKRRKEDVGGEDSDSENNYLAQRWLSPDCGVARNSDSAASSPHTPKNSLQLPFRAYRIHSSDSKGSMSCESDYEIKSPVKDRLYLKNIDTNSPSKKLHFVSGFKKRPHKSPLKNSPSHVSQSPKFVFRSPTANLPNSVLDPPQRRSPASSEHADKKVDWLTSYRLSRISLPSVSLVQIQKKSPSGASRQLFSADSSVISKKEVGPNCSSARKRGPLFTKDFDDVRHPKRNGSEEMHPKSSEDKGFCSQQSLASIQHKKGSPRMDSTKLPASMSILRYLK